MNCPNCGAAMELHGARRYFFCRHCGTFQFPEAVDENVRVLHRNQPLQCGVCRVALATAVVDNGFDAHYCERCRGVLLPRANFAELIERRRAWAATPPVAPAPLDRRELTRSIRCPGCSANMSTHPYYGPGNVIIDTCDRCDLVWLDFGELQQIADAPGQDRGQRARWRDRGGSEPDLLQILADQFGPKKTDSSI